MQGFITYFKLLFRLIKARLETKVLKFERLVLKFRVSQSEFQVARCKKVLEEVEHHYSREVKSDSLSDFSSFSDFSDGE
ncbi:MAG: hypothetical protein NTW85_06435 [Methylococcales bacterium]|nr:hypothetical protein [Methylococcales bacterium]